MKRSMIFLIIALSFGLNTTRSMATPVEKPFWERKKTYYGGAGLFGVGAAYGAYKLLFNKKRSAALGKLFSREGGGAFRGLMTRMQDPMVKASTRWLIGTLLMAYVSARLAIKGSSLKASSLPDAASHVAVAAQQDKIVQEIAALNDKMRLAIVEREQMQENLRKALDARADILKAEEAVYERLEQEAQILQAQERKMQERKMQEAHVAELDKKKKMCDALQRQVQSHQALLSAQVEAVSSDSDVTPTEKTTHTQWTFEDFQEKLKAFEASYKPTTQNPLDDAEYVSRILDHMSIHDLAFDPNFSVTDHNNASAFAVVAGSSRYGNVVSIKKAMAESLLSLEHSRLQTLRQLKGSGKAKMNTKRGLLLLDDLQIDKCISNVEIVIRELCHRLKKDLPSDVLPDQEEPKPVAPNVLSDATPAPVRVSKSVAKRPWGQGASLEELTEALENVKKDFFATRPADGTLTKEYIQYLIRENQEAVNLRFSRDLSMGDAKLFDVIRGHQGFAGFGNKQAQDAAMLTAYFIEARRRRDLERARDVVDFFEHLKEIDEQLQNCDQFNQLKSSCEAKALFLSID